MAHIVQLIKEDHRRIKAMFRAIEEASDAGTKKEIVDGVLAEMDIHASLEDDVFYPAMRRIPEMTEHINEGDEEHHVIRVLMSELHDMKPSDPHWEAKVGVFMENVVHHNDEEERDILPKVMERGTSSMGDRLGERWEEAKGRLMDQPGAMAVSGRTHS